ncbi:MAG: hypothetical protein GSR85_05070 [Desulfurococcales archaeon]|nr:hypothetical protein [Desulfurococcales archaeon]
MRKRYRRGLSELLGALLALVIMAGITASIVIITDKLVTSINNAGLGIIDRIQESTAKPLMMPGVREGVLYLKAVIPPGISISSVILEFDNGTYKIIDANQSLLESTGMPLIKGYKCEPVRIGLYTTRGNAFYTEGYYSCDIASLPGSFKLSDGTIIVSEIYNEAPSIREVSIGQTIYLYGYSILNKTLCSLEAYAQTPLGLFHWSLTNKAKGLVEGGEEVIIETQLVNITLRPYTYTDENACLIGVFLEAGRGGIIIGSGSIHTSIILLEVNQGDYAYETRGYTGPIAHSENITASGQATRQIDTANEDVQGEGTIIVDAFTGNMLTFIASSKSDLHQVNYYIILNINRAVILENQVNYINLTLNEPLRYTQWNWIIESSSQGVNKALEDLYVAINNKPGIRLILDINGTAYSRTPKHYYTELLYNTSNIKLEVLKNIRQPLNSLVNITLANVQQISPQVKSIEYNITSARRNIPIPPMPQILEVHTIKSERILVVVLPTPTTLTIANTAVNTSITPLLAGKTYTIEGNYTILYTYEILLDKHLLMPKTIETTQQTLKLLEQGTYLTLATHQQPNYQIPALLLIIAS